jgi:hypothetical protein
MSPNKEIVDKYFVSKVNGDGPENLCVCLLCYPGWDLDTDHNVKTLTKG